MSQEISFQRGSHTINATLYGQFSDCVLLCPPHPQYGGNRGDARLVAAAGELEKSGIAALCLDYSEYTGGVEEVKDIIFVLESLGRTRASLGLLGYSFGAVAASNASARFPNLKGLVLISPLKKIDHLKVDLSSSCPKLIIYGGQDRLVNRDIDKLYDSAQGEKHRLILDTDHFFAGYEEVLSRAVRDFFLNIFKS